MKLVRHKQTAYATYGRLYADDGTEVCVTLERPWVDKDRDGKRDRGVSCIVAGRYLAKRRLDSPKHGEVFELQDVPDATHIQIHAANLPDELEGCIAVGSAFGEVQRAKDPRPLPGITGSRLAFEKFMGENKDRSEFWLDVVDIDWSPLSGVGAA